MAKLSKEIIEAWENREGPVVLATVMKRNTDIMPRLCWEIMDTHWLLPTIIC